MITEASQALCDRLRSLAPTAVVRNSAQDYCGFGVRVGNKFRIAVHVGKKGMALFTQDQPLLSKLADDGIVSYAESVRPRDKDRYRFPSISMAQLEAHIEDFRQLVTESISLKEHGF